MPSVPVVPGSRKQRGLFGEIAGLVAARLKSAIGFLT
jgi:hypothetical protein